MLVNNGHHLPQIFGVKFEKSLSCLHPVLIHLRPSAATNPALLHNVATCRGVARLLELPISTSTTWDFIQQTWLVGGFSPTQLKNMLVKMGSSSPKVRGEHEQYLSCHHLRLKHVVSSQFQQKPWKSNKNPPFFFFHKSHQFLRAEHHPSKGATTTSRVTVIATGFCQSSNSLIYTVDRKNPAPI